MNTQKKNYALPIAMMFALFFMIAFVTGLQNPMGVIVKNQFGASNFLSQIGNFAIFIAYAFMGIPAGMMLQKIGYKKTALTAIIVGFLGVGTTYISGQVENFSVYILGAFITGFAMTMFNVVVNPLLNGLGSNERQGNQLLQFGGSINSIGATIVPVLVGYLMGTDESMRTIAKANPALFLAMGIFVLAFLVLYFVNIPEPFISKEKKVKEKDPHSALSFRHFVLGMVAIFIYVGVEVGIPNIANLFLTSGPEAGGMGLDTSIAGSVVGTYWFLMLVGRLTGGVLGAKFSSKAMLVTVSSIAMVLVLLGIFIPSDIIVKMPVFRSDISFGLSEVPMGVMFLVLVGLCTSVMWGSIFNLATSGLGKYTAAASGLFMTMVCGGGILPAVQGWIADMAGFMNSYFLVLAGVVYIFFYALAGHKNVNKDIKTA
ncbi:MAG: MFS transporter [Bacteroidales bacterium]|jgi:FHS family L-fucose permease-like MFS transporter|nr:MFS transporter [Bacteroidales bacterium]